MEKQKNDKKPKTRKSRAKVLTFKEFVDKTRESLLLYPDNVQNDIIMELIGFIGDERMKRVDEHRNEAERLDKLKEELPKP